MAEKQPRIRNDDERKARFNKHFARLDKDGSGQLNYNEFKEFLIKYNKKEMAEKQYDFYFRGADIDGGKSIDKDELFQLVEALQKNDKLYINKLFFRAVDKDRSREIEADEFVTMADLNGRTMTESQAADQIKKLTGGGTFLTFAQMHKALTGQEIPADTDPYDGKIPLKGQDPAPEPEAKPQTPPPKEEKKEEAKKEEAPAKKPVKEEKPPAAQNDTPPGKPTGKAKTFIIIMMILAFLSSVGYLLIGVSYLLHYDATKTDEIAGAKIVTGIKPNLIDFTEDTLKKCMNDEEFSKTDICRSISFDETLKGGMNEAAFAFMMLDNILAPGITAIVLMAVNIFAGVVLILELIGKKVGFLKAITYAPCVRGLALLFYSVPCLGAYSLLGFSAGIIGIVFGSIEFIMGIIAKIVVGTSAKKASA